MNKGRNTIELTGDVTERDFSALPQDFEGEVIVNGNLSISEDNYLKCDLSIQGNLDCPGLIVDGNLKVEGCIEYEKLRVTKNFNFKGNEVNDLDGYGGDIIVDGDCCYEGETVFDSLTVEGTLELKETKLVGGERVVCQHLTAKSVKICRTRV